MATSTSVLRDGKPHFVASSEIDPPCRPQLRDGPDEHPSSWAERRMAIILVSGLAATALGGPTLTLEGGGFRAQSAATGFVAGMLAYVGRQQAPPNPTLEAPQPLP